MGGRESLFAQSNLDMFPSSKEMEVAAMLLSALVLQSAAACNRPTFRIISTHPQERTRRGLSAKTDSRCMTAAAQGCICVFLKSRFALQLAHEYQLKRTK